MQPTGQLLMQPNEKADVDCPPLLVNNPRRLTLRSVSRHEPSYRSFSVPTTANLFDHWAASQIRIGPNDLYTVDVVRMIVNDGSNAAGSAPHARRVFSIPS